MPAQHRENVSPAENSANSTPGLRVRLTNNWVKPALAGYVVTSGMNIVMPHFFGQTIGRIPVVSDWLVAALKTIFEKAPKPILDTLMTAGSFANYKNIKKKFFVIEEEPSISLTHKISNAVIFWGSSMLVGYAIRATYALAGHVPEEGMLIPAASALPPELTSGIPQDLLSNMYIWNQDIFALNIAAQTFITPVVEVAAKFVVEKTAAKVSPYLKKCFFAAPDRDALAIAVDEDDLGNDVYAALTPTP